MGRNTPANRKAHKDKLDKKKKKDQEAAQKRKALLKEIVNQANNKKTDS